MRYFEQDHFSNCIPTWTEFLGKYVDKPVKALEIGSFEGRSATWLLDNVLTSPHSHITCIDPFGDALGIPSELLYSRFLANVSDHIDRVTVLRGSSHSFLKFLPPGTFDFIYVDGDHSSASVLTDAVLAWSLLKPDGVMVFDDFGTTEAGVQQAAKFFCTCFEPEIEVLFCAWQLGLRKVVKKRYDQAWGVSNNSSAPEPDCLTAPTT